MILGAEPVNVGLDPAAEAAQLEEVVHVATRHAAERETPWTRDLAEMVLSDFSEAPPWNET